MTPELVELDARLAGFKKWESAFTNTTNNRKETYFTWNDVAFNANNIPYHSETAIIVTSWIGQLPWLAATLANYRKSGAFVVLSYDHPVQPWDPIDNPEWAVRNLPKPLHYRLAHTVVVKHKTFDADKRIGWFWDVRYAQGLLRSFPHFKYVYVTNGDCIWERPEGLPELIALLGSGDLMSGQSEPGRTIHTADMLLKREAFDRILDYMESRMRVPILNGQSAECLLRDAVNELKLTETFAPVQPLCEDGSIDYYCERYVDSTFKQLVGFRNLFAEQEYRQNKAMEPLPAKYLDPSNDWMHIPDRHRDTLCRYYDTKDRRYLMQWWDRGEDSDYNRLFWPLAWYGTEPIYEETDEEKARFGRL